MKQNQTTTILVVLAVGWLLYQLRGLFFDLTTGGTFDAPGHMPELFNLPSVWEKYADATPAQTNRLIQRAPEIQHIGQLIATAPGILDDNENQAFYALSLLRSKAEVLVLSNIFPTSTDWLALFVFEGDNIPNAGTYLAQFLSNEEMRIVYNIIKDLPKYEQQ